MHRHRCRWEQALSSSAFALMPMQLSSGVDADVEHRCLRCHLPPLPLPHLAPLPPYPQQPPAAPSGAIIRKLHSVRFKLVLLSTAPAHSIEDFLSVVDCGYVEETHVLTCLARGNNVRRKQQRLTEPPPAVLEIRTHTNLDAGQISQHGAPLR
ncbi:hypothetical protein BHE74_00022269 [Ensete ventricosum]|nr:hypothetical protein BHE74_00022269 [Ensete ventricosum]